VTGRPGRWGSRGAGHAGPAWGHRGGGSTDGRPDAALSRAGQLGGPLKRPSVDVVYRR
jgi:hypothetical protein